MATQQRIRLISDDQLELLIHAFIDDCGLVNLSPAAERFYQRNLPKFHWWARQMGRPMYSRD